MEEETSYRVFTLTLRDCDEDTETSWTIRVDREYGDEFDDVMLNHLRESVETQYRDHKAGRAQWSEKYRW